MSKRVALPPVPAGLDHVVLRVRDMKRAIRFYRRVLGCEVARRRPSLGLVHLRAGRSMIDLVGIAGPLGREGGAAPGRSRRNMDHFCLTVRGFDEAALAAHFARFGVAIESARPRFGAEGVGPSIYLVDPDGNTVEIKGAVGK